ncbi:MAG: tetratricopeptide repeat protein, partial [Candidatus Omnitrophica bacterium]|nr:tetratricopeptide repeat protein [Candidatus Omnitrophota bacterium]
MRRFINLFIFFYLLMMVVPCYGYWVWSPKTGKWVNPVYHTFDTPEEQFVWAKGYFDEADYRKAISEFKKLVKKFPKNKLAPDAQFYIARSYEELGKYDNALKEYKIVVDVYPLSEWLPEIIERRYLIGERFFEKKKYSLAKDVFVNTLAMASYSK